MLLTVKKGFVIFTFTSVPNGSRCAEQPLQTSQHKIENASVHLAFVHLASVHLSIGVCFFCVLLLLLLLGFFFVCLFVFVFFVGCVYICHVCNKQVHVEITCFIVLDILFFLAKILRFRVVNWRPVLYIINML